MNPVLLKIKIIDFMKLFRKDFSYILMLFNDDKDQYGSEFWELDEHFKNHSFLPIVNFHKLFKDFIIENELTLSEKEFFIRECTRTFKEKILIIDSAYEKFNENSEDEECYFFQYLTCKRCAEVLIEFLDYEIKQVEQGILPNSDKKELFRTEFQLEWNNKTEISELIYALYHSKRIKVNGRPIEQKELTKVFNKLFSIEIEKPIDLLNKSVKTYKKGTDGKTFLSELNSIVVSYISQVREKETK